MTTEQLQHLKLAFVFDYARRIVKADGAESYEEFKMLGAAFPRPLLEQAHFLDEDGMLAPAFRDHRDMAHQLLPQHLSDDEKAEMIELLFQASAIDAVDAAEIAIVEEAGAALGLDEAAVTALIASFASA
jgi:hypothetical protein